MKNNVVTQGPFWAIGDADVAGACGGKELEFVVAGREDQLTLLILHMAMT